MQKVRLTYLNSQYPHTQEKGYIYAIATALVGGWLQPDLYACPPVHPYTPLYTCTPVHLYAYVVTCTP